MKQSFDVLLKAQLQQCILCLVIVLYSASVYFHKGGVFSLKGMLLLLAQHKTQGHKLIVKIDTFQRIVTKMKT